MRHADPRKAPRTGERLQVLRALPGRDRAEEKGLPVKWEEIGFNTWQLGEVIIYLAQLPHQVWFATKSGEQRKFTDKKEMLNWIKS